METRKKLMIAGGVALALYTFSKPSGFGGPLTTSSTSDLSLLNPVARQKVAALLARMDNLGVPFRVIETLRSRERQAALFAKGRTAPGSIVTYLDGSPGKESRHQSGNAADLVLDVKRWPANLGPKPTGAYDLGVEGGRVVRPSVLAAWHLLGHEAQMLGLRWLGGPAGGKLDPVTKLAFDAPHVEVPG